VNIKRISMRFFMGHKCTDIDLPASGVVVVSGPNGAGKSSFIEAVSWSSWGKTLRGTDPVDTNATTSSAGIQTTQGLVIGREKTTSKTKLTWALEGEEATIYESTSKGQAALTQALNFTHSVWKRTSVFSSSDSSLFATASDADRKNLLEDLLGHDRFNPALDSCRADIRIKEKALEKAEAEISLKNQLLAGELLHQAKLNEFVPSEVPDIQALEAEQKALERSVIELDAVCANLNTEVQREQRDAHERAVLLRQLTASLDRVNRDTCTVCEQPIPLVLKQTLQDQLALAENDNAVANQDYEERVGALRVRANAVSRKRDGVFSALRDVRQKISDGNRDLSTRARCAGQSASATRTIESLKLDLEDLKEDRKALAKELKELQAVERVLGMRGVRASLLGRALGGLEASCNAWLSRFAKGVWVKILPYTERGSGAVVECISLNIEGVGAGQGYKAASGGERRRIDVALILALGEFAAASFGAPVGTMFADEIFDALDTEGVAAVAEALRDLSKDRCVVVISHNADLLAQLKGTHVEVREGKIYRTSVSGNSAAKG
jgi:DNA repair exonuclease SbcCD ATPase subunit